MGQRIERQQFEDLLRRVAQFQGSAESTSGSGQKTILFLGNAYNPLSVACLQAVVALGHKTFVGSYEPPTRAFFGLGRKRAQERGWAFVLARFARLVRCKMRIVFRAVGLPLSGYASIQELCRRFELQAIRCADPNDAEFLHKVQSLGVDLIVVASFARILKRQLIEIPRLGCINVHPSLLPLYRGPDPIYWVLANRERLTGVTVHHVDEGIDTGDIILQRVLKIRPKETENSLTERSAAEASQLLCRAIRALIAGKAPRIRQENSAASYHSFPQRSGRGQQRQARVRVPETVLAAHVPSRPVYAIDPLQDPRWKAFIYEHPNASIYHTIPWLDALRRTYDYEPVIYSTSPTSADLRDGIVICRVKSHLTGRRLVSLPFSDHCAPLVDSDQSTDAIFSHIRTQVSSGDWEYAEFRLPGGGLPSAVQALGFQPSARYYLHEIDLQDSEDQIFKKLDKSSVQRRIRHGMQQDLFYESGRSDVLLAKFRHMNLLARRRHRLPPQPEAWFRNLVTCMGEALTIHIASYKGDPVAGILTLQFRGTLVYKYGGSDQNFHRLGSMPFLLWKAIQEAKSQGVKTFDLGRSDHDNLGLVAFKDKWASSQSLMSYWRFPVSVRNHFVDKGKTFALAKSLFGLLPSPIFQFAGEILYRHIG